jgi:hypothetical protein
MISVKFVIFIPIPQKFLMVTAARQSDVAANAVTGTAIIITIAK